jgi:putative transposase
MTKKKLIDLDQLFSEHIPKNVTKNKSDILFEKVLLSTQKYWLPVKSDNKNIIDSNSWFDIEEFKTDTPNKKINANIKVSDCKSVIKCEKIKMYPNKLQKELLINWMNSYITMYNETIKLFKQLSYDKKYIPLSWKTLRTSYLKNAKSIIIKNSQIIRLTINTKVNTHVLDGAIKEACSNYKACLTNLRNGNIKHFRLRYIKYSKPNKIIHIEKYFISLLKGNTFCPSVFKDNFKLENGFKMSTINKDFTIQYKSDTNEFYLLNPIEELVTKAHKNKDTVSVDPGIRTFAACYSNNKCIKICNNLRSTLIKYIKKIDKVNNNKDIPASKKRKVESRCYKKIGNLVDDMHWKTIKYLTDNFGNILIGNLSTKEIVKNRANNVLDRITKRLALLMGLSKFKQRLAYKCTIRKVGCGEVDEAYTTKTCTKCGFKNETIGAKKVINCGFCKLKIDRDFNGARNIMLRHLDVN